MHCIENFFTVQHFWTTCLCPEKQFSLNFFTVFIIHFLSFRILGQLALTLKNRFDLKFFTLLKYLYYSGFLSNLCLPWKVSLYWVYFLHSGFLSSWRLPSKTECALNSLAECIFFIIQDFSATCAYAEKQSCPEIFHCFENFFIIHEFWATCACPENRVCPEIFHWIEIFFIIQEFWATCPCPENRICPENFQASWRQPPRRHPPRTPPV